MIKVLNLYAGIGGNRKLWTNVEVTAIEHNEEIAQIYQDFYSNDNVIITDAHQYLLENYDKFDFIWSSPPCPTHSRMKKLMIKSQHKINVNRKAEYPNMKLYEEIILLKHYFKGKYVVENVISYYEPLIKPIERHRHYFWTNFFIELLKLERAEDIIHSNVEKLQLFHNISLDKYDISKQKKEIILRNCVHSKLGLHIFKCAFEQKQVKLIDI